METIIEDKTIIETESTIIENDTSSSTEITSFKDYNIISQFPTKGAEADIYLIEKDNQKFVLKLYRLSIKPKKELIEKLVYLSDKYQKDIIKIYEIDFDEITNRWYEIQEYAKFGSLIELVKNEYNFVLANLKTIIKEIVSILVTLHNENIIHRDLKPENILIREKTPLDLIITDFGISSILDEEFSKKLTSKSGTRIYFSPESFSGYIGKEVDFWALGMIILEILSQGNLFKGLNEAVIAHEIFTKGVEIPTTLPQEYQLLLKGLLTKDPKKRWSETEINRWLQGERDIKVYYEFIKEENLDIKPYEFAKQKFYNLSDLLLKMIEPQNYELAKKHIFRGYIVKWLEKNEWYDDAIYIEEVIQNYKNSDEVMEEIFKLSDVTNQIITEKKAEEFYQDAKYDFEFQDYKEAKSKLKKAINLNPLEKYNFLLGEIYFELGEYQNSIEIILEALQKHPNNERYNFILAVSYIKLEKYEKSLEYAKKLLSVNEIPRYYSLIASIYAYLENIKESIKYLEIALDMNPNVREYKEELAENYFILSELEENNTIDYLKKSIEINPLNKYKKELANIYLELGKKENKKILEYYYKAVKLYPQNYEKIKDVLDKFLTKQSNKDLLLKIYIENLNFNKYVDSTSIEVLEKIIQISPEKKYKEKLAELYVERVKLYKTSEAKNLQVYQKAYKLAPKKEYENKIKELKKKLAMPMPLKMLFIFIFSLFIAPIFGFSYDEVFLFYLRIIIFTWFIILPIYYFIKKFN